MTLSYGGGSWKWNSLWRELQYQKERSIPESQGYPERQKPSWSKACLLVGLDRFGERKTVLKWKPCLEALQPYFCLCHMYLKVYLHKTEWVAFVIINACAGTFVMLFTSLSAALQLGEGPSFLINNSKNKTVWLFLGWCCTLTLFCFYICLCFQRRL